MEDSQIIGLLFERSEQAIRAVQEKYGGRIDRKAVKRQLELLGAMPFSLIKCKEGYHIKSLP